MNSSSNKPLWNRFATAYLSFLRNLPAASFLFIVGCFVCRQSFGSLTGKQIVQGVVGLLSIAAGVLSYIANGYELSNIFSSDEKKKTWLIITITVVLTICIGAFIDQALWAIDNVVSKLKVSTDHK